MTDLFLSSCRVEAFRDIEPSQEATKVIESLGVGELSAAIDGFAEAMTAALWHDSYLYENQGEAPGLTFGALSALEALGKTWLARELALMVNASRYDEKPGTLSRTVAGARQVLSTTLPERAAWSCDWGRFSSRGLQGGRPPSVHLRVIHQVLGLVCLCGGSPALSAYMEPFLREALRRAESKTIG